jgi:hypothetical protein
MVLFSRSSGSAREVLVAEYCCAAMRSRLPYSHTYYGNRGARQISREPASKRWVAIIGMAG